VSQPISNPNGEDLSKEGACDIIHSSEGQGDKIVENPSSNLVV